MPIWIVISPLYLCWRDSQTDGLYLVGAPRCQGTDRAGRFKDIL